MHETVRELEMMPMEDLEDFRIAVEGRIAQDNLLLKRVNLALEFKKEKKQKEDMFTWMKENLVDRGILPIREFFRIVKKFQSP